MKHSSANTQQSKLILIQHQNIADCWLPRKAKQVAREHNYGKIKEEGGDCKEVLDPHKHICKYLAPMTLPTTEWAGSYHFSKNASDVREREREIEIVTINKFSKFFYFLF